MQYTPIEPPREMSLDEWAAREEDAEGELVDGRLVEEEVPTNLHELIVAWLVRTLGNWVRPRGGWVFGSEHKLAVAPRRGRKPDVTVYAPGTKLRANASLSRSPPHVVIEVVSTQARDVRRDRVDKLAEYAAFGVKHYWLIDHDTRLFELLELGADGRYVIARAALDGRIEPSGCEGLVLDLDALAAEAAELEEGEPGEG